MKSGIYELKNKKNGKVYIGSAVNLRLRLYHHRNQLNCGKHRNKHLQCAWGKHGAESFDFRPLLYCDPKLLLFYEQRCIDGYKSADPEFGYNIAKIAGSQLGFRHSPESKAKFIINGNTRKGVPKSPQHAENVAAALRGKKRSAEFCAKVKANHAVLTPEQLADIGRKVSAALKGVPKSAEHSAKVAAANRGKRRSPETLERMSVAAKGKPWSAARRAAQMNRSLKEN